MIWAFPTSVIPWFWDSVAILVASLPLQSLKRKVRNFMKCLFNRNNTEFQIFSKQSKQNPCGWWKILHVFFSGKCLFLPCLWDEQGLVDAVFSVLWCEAPAGSSAFCCLLLWFLPASSWAHSPLELECRNCSGKVALKGLTCLLLSSLLHINTFVSLSLLQFAAKSPWLQWEYIEM